MSSFVSDGYYRQIVQLQAEVAALTARNKELEDLLQIATSRRIHIQIGDRVKVNEKSGFHCGAEGIVQFVEPSYERIWVLRDHAETAAFFFPKELDVLVRAEDAELDQKENG